MRCWQHFLPLLLPQQQRQHPQQMASLLVVLPPLLGLLPARC
jgi:hypothetical protein